MKKVDLLLKKAELFEVYCSSNKRIDILKRFAEDYYFNPDTIVGGVSKPGDVTFPEDTITGHISQPGEIVMPEDKVTSVPPKPVQSDQSKKLKQLFDFYYAKLQEGIRKPDLKTMFTFMPKLEELVNRIDKDPNLGLRDSVVKGKALVMEAKNKIGVNKPQSFTDAANELINKKTEEDADLGSRK